VFSDLASRNEILEFNYQAKIDEKYVVNVWRNTSFEVYEKLIVSFLSQVGMQASFNYSGYDTSFDLRTRQKEVDLDLFLVDARELATKDLLEILNLRLSELKSQLVSRVLVCLITEGISLVEVAKIDSFIADNPELNFVQLNSGLSDEILTNFIDTRLSEITGTSVSGKWHVRVAREIALKGIFRTLNRKLKLIAVDFDNTLVLGTVAEDPEENIKVGEFQVALINKLTAAKESGILIALVSRNVEEDVVDLLAKRNDLGIDIKLFDFRYCSWEPKDLLLKKLFELTRIAPDACLFIDDNPMEILRVTSSFPEIKYVLAGEENAAKNALDCLVNFNVGKEISREDKIRAKDIHSNAIRESLFTQQGSGTYKDVLDPQLNYYSIDDALLQRAYELSNKTNQFNLSLSRFTINQLNDMRQDKSIHIVLASLEDKLSDSGIISLLVFTASSREELTIMEFAVSCRAIGRGLENEIFENSIKHAIPPEIGIKTRVNLLFKAGPRNSPVLDWLQHNAEISSSNKYIKYV
jgi:FkbH-like protein